MDNRSGIFRPVFACRSHHWVISVDWLHQRFFLNRSCVIHLQRLGLQSPESIFKSMFHTAIQLLKRLGTKNGALWSRLCSSRARSFLRYMSKNRGSESCLLNLADNYHLYSDSTGFIYDITLTRPNLATNKNERYHVRVRHMSSIVPRIITDQV